MGDLRLMHEWLQRPHVRRWWSKPETYEEVLESYAPAISGRDPTDLYVVLLEGREIGFIETYLVVDYPDYVSLIGLGEGTAGVESLHCRDCPDRARHRERDAASVRRSDRVCGRDDSALCGWARGWERCLGTGFRESRLSHRQRVRRRRQPKRAASARSGLERPRQGSMSGHSGTRRGLAPWSPSRLGSMSRIRP